MQRVGLQLKGLYKRCFIDVSVNFALPSVCEFSHLPIYQRTFDGGASRFRNFKIHILVLQRNVDVVVDPVPGHEATKGVPQARQLNGPLQSPIVDVTQPPVFIGVSEVVFTDMQ